MRGLIFPINATNKLLPFLSLINVLDHLVETVNLCMITFRVLCNQSFGSRMFGTTTMSGVVCLCVGDWRR